MSLQYTGGWVSSLTSLHDFLLYCSSCSFFPTAYADRVRTKRGHVLDIIMFKCHLYTSSPENSLISLINLLLIHSCTDILSAKDKYGISGYQL